MRFVRPQQTRDRDEQLGLVYPPSLIPRLWRRRGSFSVRPTLFHRPISLGYVSWLAFLTFWIVFGRAMVFYLMTTTTVDPDYRGVPIELMNIALSGSDVDDLRAGRDVSGPNGPIEFNRIDYNIYHLKVGKDDRSTINDEDLRQFDKRSVCANKSVTGRRSVFLVSMLANASYQETVSAVDFVHSTEWGGCLPTVYLTSVVP